MKNSGQIKLSVDDLIKQSVLFNSLPDNGVIRLECVMAVLGGVSRSTVLRACDNGTLPKPIKLKGDVTSKRTNLWRVSDIRNYLSSL